MRHSEPARLLCVAAHAQVAAIVQLFGAIELLFQQGLRKAPGKSGSRFACLRDFFAAKVVFHVCGVALVIVAATAPSGATTSGLVGQFQLP